MITKCYICDKELDTNVDKYVSQLEYDGSFKNNEQSKRAHFDCAYKYE